MGRTMFNDYIQRMPVSSFSLECIAGHQMFITLPHLRGYATSDNSHC